MAASITNGADRRAIPLLQKEICFATVREMVAGSPYEPV